MMMAPSWHGKSHVVWVGVGYWGSGAAVGCRLSLSAVVEILRRWKGRLLQDLKVVVFVILNIAMSNIAVAKRGLS